MLLFMHRIVPYFLSTVDANASSRIRMHYDCYDFTWNLQNGFVDVGMAFIKEIWNKLCTIYGLHATSLWWCSLHNFSDLHIKSLQGLYMIKHPHYDCNHSWKLIVRIKIGLDWWC